MKSQWASISPGQGGRRSATQGTGLTVRRLRRGATAYAMPTVLNASLSTMTPAISLKQEEEAHRVAYAYAKRLKAEWPEAEVFWRYDPSRLGELSVVVVGEEWDYEQEYAAFHLRSPLVEDLGSDLFLDVDVVFRRIGEPDLAEFSAVAL